MDDSRLTKLYIKVDPKVRWGEHWNGTGGCA